MLFRNILIYGHSSVGDVIYDLAVVDPLREHCPRANISFVTSSRCRDIVDGYPGVSQVIVFDRNGKSKGFLNRSRVTLGLRKNKFDLAVVLNSSLNYLFLRPPVVWRVREAAQPQNVHPVDRYIGMLRAKGLKIGRGSFGFRTTAENAVFREDFLKQKGVASSDKVIGILPLAAWPLKSWPVEKWNKLAEILDRRWGVKTLNLGSFPDNELGRRVAENISRLIISADNTTLGQARALLERCQMFIGPDSSFLHLASCMGIETVGLYGATPYERFYPYFHRLNVISSRNRLPCMPCYPGGKPSCCSGKTKYDFGPCMEGIEVDDVAALVAARLNLK